MAEVGRILGGRYRLVELLGQGGMARIFRAQDAQLGRAVAVKVLRAEYGTDEAFIARFRQEAQSVAALDHPNIVNVFDYGTDEAGPFIVMELVTAGDLAQLLRERGALPPDAAARIARQVADALAAAHSRGIVHRDIKPSNVLLTDAGRVKVGDFGIAQAFAEAELTVPGMTMGSVHYFSPEQARGETTAPASDIYALGLMLYEMLTGNRAWVGDTAAAVAMARLTGEVPSPAAVRAGIPAELDDITRWALSPDPAARPSAERLAAALARLEAPAGAVTVAAAPTVVGVSYGGGRTPPPADADDRSAGRWGWLAAILGLLVLVAAGVLLFLFLGNGGRSQPSPSPSISLVTVPQLVGLTVPEAQSAAAAARLSMTVGSFEETRAAPDNTILAQDPAASAMTEQGATITVVVATTQATVQVPDLRRLTESEFVAALAEAELMAGQRFEDFHPEIPAGAVIRTDPRAGVEVVKGTTIDYVLSRGPEPLPSPSPSPSPTPSPSPSPSPTPSPSATAEPTPTPTPEPTPTPTPEPTPTPTPEPTPSPSPSPSPSPEASPVVVGNYLCQDLLTTRGQIESIGLVLDTVFPGSGPEFDGWLVSAQDPLPAAEVPPGSGVDLIVSDPATPCP